MYAALQKVSPLTNGYHWEYNATFGTTDNYSRSDMYTRCSFPVFCSLSPGSLFLADNKEQFNEL